MRYLSSLLFATMLSAQINPFSQPVATDDGQTVYFLSPLILKTAPDPVPPTGGSSSNMRNLYRLGKNGFELLSASATTPQVSGDGSVVGYTDPNVCVTTDKSTSCGSKAMLLGPPAMDLGTGSLQLSRNGRWAVVGGFPTPLFPVETALIDTTTGTRVPLPGATVVGALSVVASDGTVLLQQTGTNQIGLWRNGLFTPLASIYPMALSDDASTVIYSVSDTPGGAILRVVARNLMSGAEVMLVDKLSSPIALMGLSSDGRSILFRTIDDTSNGSGAAYLATAGTGKTEMIELPDGEAVFDGTISGSGNSVILTTTLGRMVRVAVAAGVPGPMQELVPSTPYLNSNTVAVGSYAELGGTLNGTVESLTGKILFGGVPLVILGVKPGEVDVQVPWEVPAGYALFQVLPSSTSPFKQDQLIFASSFGPRYFDLPLGQTTVLGPVPLIRGDFSGFQTTQPQAGDIVVLYMAGLGPVLGSPVTGSPAPVTPLHTLVGTLTCRFLPQPADAKTLYAGLAPGMIGIYQIVFQMPDDVGTAPLNGMRCSYSGPGIGASFGFGGLMVSQH